MHPALTEKRAFHATMNWRHVTAAALLVACACVASLTRAAEPAAGPGLVNPLDKDDAQIAAFKKLDWKGIDFTAEEPQSRCVSLLALNAVAKRMGGKSDARLDLLVDYFNDHHLGEAFAGHMMDDVSAPPISYDDARKVAVAFIRSPAGVDKFGGDLDGCDAITLKAYEKMYERSARASYDETIASRVQVAAMARYLEKVGKLDEFTSWAVDERQKRQAAYEKEMATRRAEYAQTAAQKQEQQLADRDAAWAEHKAKQAEAEEQAAREMEAGMDATNDAGADQGAAPGQFYSDAFWPWNGSYYATGAYRGSVADKADGAYKNWNGNRIRAGGGGRRR